MADPPGRSGRVDRWSARDVGRSYHPLVGWLAGYRFPEDFRDLRGQHRAHADSLAAELRRELGDGHELTSRGWVVVAEALPQDEVVLGLAGGGVALVHLTWTGRTETAPYPLTRIVMSESEFESLVKDRY